ncbi:MAG TPA: M15 family metallopeptidase [Acidimicrobiales bacterium]|nr:M15 family metallopeptidase [Acidimicrobiales bacterium]
MKLSRRWSRAACALVGSAIVTVVAPAPSGAQDDPTDREQLRGDQTALASVDVDVLNASSVDVGDTLVDIRENVATQKAMLTQAETVLATAQADLAAAEAALADTRLRLAAVNDDAGLVVVDSFIDPPVESALDVLSADSLVDATVKQSILDREADKHASALHEYEALQEQLEAEEAGREEAAAAAEAAEAEAAAALADVNAAVSQQAAFAVAVDLRLDQQLAEADALQNTNPELAEQIRAREAELAMALNELDEEVQAERARARAAELAAQAEQNKAISGLKPVPGGVVDVVCPAGGTVQVAGDISASVERLLADAYEAGVAMCGFGYRDPAEQIAVRRANCGSSSYAIYEAPSSYCSPPTARPGTSLHEQGLAIDFSYVGGSTIGYGSGAYEWLKANAANYGLYNLPGEPWHWSVDGN